MNARHENDVLDLLRWRHRFETPEARRLAGLFAIVYFAQGMWALPNQTLIITLKERGLSAGQVATVFTVVAIPWMIKPVYGLLSDFVPLFGQRRRSYLLLSSALAAGAGLALGLVAPHTYWWLVGLVTVMGLGLAFTDVVVDALMVENGKALGLTGAFQAVQWGAVYTAAILVGELGGLLAERRRLGVAYGLAALFPLISFGMTLFVVHDRPAPAGREGFRQSVAAIRAALGARDLWIVAGFILFWTFSPSFGPALLYYQTDVLGFSQQFNGHLGALASIAAVGGAFIYAPISRAVPLRRLVNAAIGLAAATTLTYLLYRGAWSAIAINVAFGCVGMITQLVFLDLAARACPPRVPATFFALLMSVFNAGAQGSQVVGAHLYDWLGYTPLVLISAAFTALGWLLVPLVRIDELDLRAQAAATAHE